MTKWEPIGMWRRKWHSTWHGLVKSISLWRKRPFYCAFSVPVTQWPLLWRWTFDSRAWSGGPRWGWVWSGWIPRIAPLLLLFVCVFVSPVDSQSQPCSISLQCTVENNMNNNNLKKTDSWWWWWWWWWWWRRNMFGVWRRAQTEFYISPEYDCPPPLAL